MAHQHFEYVGLELDLFARALNWRGYWANKVAPYLGEQVLEIGAGIGSTTLQLRSYSRSWTAVEPDEGLARQINEGERAPATAVVVGNINDIPREPKYDTVLYIDVLEHIEDDRWELMEAAERLRQGGFLVVLAPAHQWLFSPFDEAVGHFRRYSRKTLRDIAPAGTTEVEFVYLDSVGILLSGANRFLLRSTLPTHAQVRFWDRYLIPLSRVLDAMTGKRVGKTVLMVWRRVRE